MANWRLVDSGNDADDLTTTVTFYLITAYMPTYGTSVLHLTATSSMLVTLARRHFEFVLAAHQWAHCPIRSDGGRCCCCSSTIALLTPYPVLLWLVSAPSFGRLLAAALWFSMIFGSYNGSMVVFLTEIMPADVRVSGFSFAYSLATGIFGGFTPAVSTWLIHATGNAPCPAYGWRSQG